MTSEILVQRKSDPVEDNLQLGEIAIWLRFVVATKRPESCARYSVSPTFSC